MVVVALGVVKLTALVALRRRAPGAWLGLAAGSSATLLLAWGVGIQGLPPAEAALPAVCLCLLLLAAARTTDGGFDFGTLPHEASIPIGGDPP
jgi:hypothetical protein